MVEKLRYIGMKKILLGITTFIVIVFGVVAFTHKNVQRIIAGNAYSYEIETVQNGRVSGGIVFSKSAEKYERYSDVNKFYDKVKAGDFKHDFIEDDFRNVKVENNKKIWFSDGLNYQLPDNVQVTELTISGKTIKGRILTEDGKRTFGTITFTQQNK